MGASPKFRKLLEDLRDATLQGKLQWSETADESEFRVNFDYAMIRVGQAYSADGDTYVLSASLLTPKGRVVEQFTASGGMDYALLEELYDLARRSALKADDLLDRVISEVENLTAPHGK